MKNLSACLLLLFILTLAAVAQFRNHDLAAEFEGMKVTLLSRTETFKAYFTVAVKATSISGIDKVTINNETAIAAENDEFYATVKLDHGANTITVTAIAKNDAQKQETFTLHRTRPKSNEDPTITIIKIGTQDIGSTGDAILVSEEETLIRGTVTASKGVNSLEVNDKVMVVAANGVFETKFFLDYGTNLITIKATDNEGNSSTQAFTIYQRPDRDGKDFALLFATDAYSGEKDENENWQDLESPGRDSEAVAKNLRDNYGFETKVFKNLTRRELLNTLYTYRSDFEGTEYTEGSQILLFFAGHGYYNEEEEEGYLITADTDSFTVDPTLASAVSHEKLRKEIDRIECQRILVLLDTCQSGIFDPNFKALPEIKSVLQDMFLLEKLKRKLTLEARWCLTAAGTEYVVDGTTSRSPFAEAFLEALDSRGGIDSVLILDEVWEKVRQSKEHPIYDKIVEAKKKAGEEFEKPNPQKGQFGKDKFDESDFLFFPKIE